MPVVNIKTTYRVARKEHHCDLCKEVIKVGERYRRDTLAYQGRLYDFTSHCDCDELTRVCDMVNQLEDYDEGLNPELFANIIWDKVSEYLPYEAVCRMTVHEQVKYVFERLKKE